MGIQRKHHHIRRPHQRRVDPGGGGADDALFQRKIHRRLLLRDGVHPVAPGGQPLGIAAAQQSQTDDEYVHILFQLHGVSSVTGTPKAASRSK